MSDFAYPQLPHLGWVAGLRDDDRELLASYGEFIPSHPGTDLITQGEDQRYLFMLVSGSLEVRRVGLEEDVIVAVIKPGESIGEVNIFDPGVASASVRAREFSQVWRIDREMLDSYLRDCPVAGNSLLVGLLVILSKRLRDLNSKLVDAKSSSIRN